MNLHYLSFHLHRLDALQHCKCQIVSSHNTNYFLIIFLIFTIHHLICIMRTDALSKIIVSSCTDFHVFISVICFA